MANGVYVYGRRAAWSGSIDLLNDSISVWLVDLTYYTPDLNNDTSLADIGTDPFVSEALLTGKTLDGTTFRADDTTFAAVTSDKTVNGIVVFKDTGVYSTSTLLCVYDTSPEFPYDPDGSDVTIIWDTGVSGIFRF